MGYIHRHVRCLAFCAAFAGVPFLDVDVDAKDRVPVAAARKEAEASIRKLYKSELSAREEDDQRRLVSTFVDLAKKSRSNPAGAFVLLKIAKDTAIDLGDVDLTMQVVDEIDRSFRVNRLSLLSDTLTRCVKTTHRESQLQAIVRLAIGGVDTAIEKLDAERATALRKAARGAARKTGSKWLLFNASREKEKIETFSRWLEKHADAVETLVKSPNDPAACAEVGAFLCFTMHEWDDGLRLLARGPPGPLRTLARDDLQTKTGGVPERLAIAHRWQELASESSNDQRDGALERAYGWYQAVVEDLDGLDKAETQRKLLLRPSQYLADLEAFDVELGYGALGRYDRLGYANGRIVVDGVSPRYALSMHPPSQGFSQARFKIDESYKSLEGFAALNHTARRFGQGVFFVIRGDGRTLWKSKALKKPNEAVPFEVSVRGVEVLELTIHRPRSSGECHAVWLEPMLTR